MVENNLEFIEERHLIDSEEYNSVAVSSGHRNILSTSFFGNKICRACLRSCDNPVHLFGHRHFLNGNTLQECLEEMCNIQISPNDNLPETICIKCVNSLHGCLTFRKIVRKNDEFLHKILQGGFIVEDHISDEDAIVDTQKYNLQSTGKLENYSCDFSQYIVTTEDNLVIEQNLENLVDPNNPKETTIIPAVKENEHMKQICNSSNELIEENQDIIRVENHQPSIRYIKLKEMSFQNTSVKKFSCEYCPQKFAYLKNKRQHQRRHFRDGDHLCSVCEKKFFTKAELQRHYFCHTNIKQYKCQVCNKEFVTQPELNRHMKTHNDVKEFKCGTCGREFSLKEKLSFHIKTVHLKRKKYSCEKCGKFFTTPSKMKRHQLSRFCNKTKSVITVHKGDQFTIIEKDVDLEEEEQD